MRRGLSPLSFIFKKCYYTAMTQKKHLGCSYWFEAYLQKSTLDGEAWDATINAILHHVGVLRTLKIVYRFEGNLIHYYFGANKDLTGLSNRLEKLSLRAVAFDDIPIPKVDGTQWFVRFVSGGSLLDLRERVALNRGSTLEWVLFSIKLITPQSIYTNVDLVFQKPDGTKKSSRKHMVVLPGKLLAVNFRENEKYAYKKFSKHLDIQKTLHILKSDNSDALMEVETYPYLPKNAYLSLSSYDFDKHSLIIGASGSGKSKLIGLFTDRLLSSPLSQQYRVIVIDPHASLEDDLRSVHGANIIHFKSNDDSTELFADSGTDISAATELTTTLFESLLGNNYSVKLERVLRYSLVVLMTAQVMSLENLKRLLIDSSYRDKLIAHVRDFIPDNISQYFMSDYQKVYNESYSDSIVPIIELIDEINVQASPTSRGGQASSLAKVVQANQLTVFSLNKVAMGEKVIKTVAGLLIQQLFLLAQAKQFNEKIILIIDEVSVIQNPTIAQILAEARKYNLFVFLTQQYFGQVNKELQDAIFSNVSNYFVFKVSESDARALEGNITMELPRKMTMEATRIVTMEEDLRVPILTSLDPREVVARVSSQGKILPAFKAKTLDFHPSETRPNVEPLQRYQKQRMPVKFSEPEAQSSAINNEDLPQIGSFSSTNLMEVLAKQSSARNQKQKE